MGEDDACAMGHTMRIRLVAQRFGRRILLLKACAANRGGAALVVLSTGAGVLLSVGVWPRRVDEVFRFALSSELVAILFRVSLVFVAGMNEKARLWIHEQGTTPPSFHSSWRIDRTQSLIVSQPASVTSVLDCLRV